MSKHTPGPWAYIESDNVFVAANVGQIINVQPTSLRVSVEERNANGHLIAAAPDLLEGCRRAVAALDTELGGCDCHNVKADFCAACFLRAAIAKAEGRGFPEKCEREK